MGSVCSHVENRNVLVVTCSSSAFAIRAAGVLSDESGLFEYQRTRCKEQFIIQKHIAS